MYYASGIIVYRNEVDAISLQLFGDDVDIFPDEQKIELFKSFSKVNFQFCLRKRVKALLYQKIKLQTKLEKWIQEKVFFIPECNIRTLFVLILFNFTEFHC